MNRAKIKTSKKQIVEYWARHLDESELSVDFAEAEELCWRCGCKRPLERCHIIPDSLGGKDIPSNFVLLCKRCHLDNPNVADQEIMWDWLKSYKVSFYGTFWNIQGVEEYEKIYSVSFEEELEKRNIGVENLDEINQIFKDQITNTTYHFGDPHLNVATLAGVYRMTIKEYDKRHKLKTDKKIIPYIHRKK